MGQKRAHQRGSIAEPNRKKDPLLSWQLLNEKPYTFVYYSHSHFFFPSIKLLFPRCVVACMWLTMVADSELQFFSDPK